MSTVRLFKFLLTFFLLLRIGEAANMKEIVDTLKNSKDMDWRPKMPDPSLEISHIPKPPPIDRDCPEIKHDTKQQLLPRFFDARKHWTACSNIIGRVREQGDCDSSWAHATVGMLSDRMCIESGGSTKVHLSARDVMSCCRPCRVVDDHPCHGGCAMEVIKYWKTRGLVTGGPYESGEGCQPLPEEFFRFHHTPGYLDCQNSCTNRQRRATYKKYRGAMGYRVPSDEESIKREILHHGPVVTSMITHVDFISYESGVYHHRIGGELGVQYLKLIGWGTETGRKYWLAMNSQGTKFGEQGLIKIKRGTNHSGVESGVIGASTSNKVSHREEKISFDGASAVELQILRYILVEVMLLCLFL